MNKRLILRNCRPDGTSQNGFKWNTEIGAVNTCPDWVDNNECGNGLHGWLDGIGDSTVSNYNDSPLWLVAEVETFNDCRGKVKFRSCTVVFTGSMIECSQYLFDQGIRGPIIGLTGDHSEGGDLSVLSAVGKRMQSSGRNSTQTAGDYSTQTAGHSSTQTAGNYSTQTAGYNSTQKAGHDSTQTAGDNSTQTAGYNSNQTAGDISTQTAGSSSTQTAGNHSTITCGNHCKVTAGLHSVVIHRFWYGLKYKTAEFLIREDKADKTFMYLNGKQYIQKDGNWVLNTFFGRLFNITK